MPPTETITTTEYELKLEYKPMTEDELMSEHYPKTEMTENELMSEHDMMNETTENEYMPEHDPMTETTENKLMSEHNPLAEMTQSELMPEHDPTTESTSQLRLHRRLQPHQHQWCRQSRCRLMMQSPLSQYGCLTQAH